MSTLNKPVEKDKFCHIVADRNLGNQQYQITVYGDLECTLLDPKTGQSFNIYRHHLYTTYDDRRASTMLFFATKPLHIKAGVKWP